VEETLAFVARYGYAIVAAWILLDQIGLPIPSAPVLLAAGALAGHGQLGLVPLLVVATLASLPANLLLHQLGRRHGIRFLGLLCRISLEPDTCVRTTEASYARHGARTLIAARFVPGLGLAAPPLAGMFGMSAAHFALYDAAGAFAYSAAFLGLGYFFRDQLERVVDGLAAAGVGLGAAAGVGLAIYLIWKYLDRRRVMRALRLRRIEPARLRAMLDSGEPVEILDLRPRVAFAESPLALPGARRVDLEELALRHAEIPRDRDIILYCT
jgi:membrane protein DedA with SNARE-associated domain